MNPGEEFAMALLKAMGVNAKNVREVVLTIRTGDLGRLDVKVDITQFNTNMVEFFTEYKLNVEFAERQRRLQL